jgi:Ser/Thr protein kinase RdoA (MazF antagonist)
MDSDDKRPGTEHESLLDIIAAWDIKVSGQVEHICPEGIFRLSSEQGDDLILKDIGPIDDRLLSQLAFEHEVLRHLQAAGLPVALPLPDIQGRTVVPWRDRALTLSPCLPNDSTASMPAHRDRLLRNYGAAIARMHQALITFPPAEIPDWIDPIDLTSEVFDTGFPIILRYLKGAQADQFQATFADLNRTMPAALQHLPQQLIHRDCHAENLLSCDTEVTGIVDWDHLTIGPRILDIAYFAVQLAKRQVRNPEAMAQWLDELPLLLGGYEAESILLEKEKVAFPYALISVPVLFAHWAIGTRHSDDYIQTELDTMAWLYRNVEVIPQRVQAV